MKGFVEHVISRCREVEKELEREYEEEHAALSHRDLLALQLSGVSDVGQLKTFKGKPCAAALEKADRLLERQKEMGIRTVGFMDIFSYPERLNAMGQKRPLLFHCIGDTDLLRTDSMLMMGARTGSKLSGWVVENLCRVYGEIPETRDSWLEKKRYSLSDFPYAENSPYAMVVGLSDKGGKNMVERCLSLGGECIVVVPGGLDVLALPAYHKLVLEILESGVGLIVSPNAVGNGVAGGLQDVLSFIVALSSVVAVTGLPLDKETARVAKLARIMKRPLLAVDYELEASLGSESVLLLQGCRAHPIRLFSDQLMGDFAIF